MIKTALMHFICEHSLNLMFDNIHKNFMFANPNMILQEGKRFSLIECDWLGYYIRLTNIKIRTIKQFELIGTFIEIETNDPVYAVIDPSDYEHDVLDLHRKQTFNKSFTPCEECYLKDMYYIIDSIAVGEMKIRVIQV